MAEWFLMIMFPTNIVFVGPFTEQGCHDVQNLMFRGIAAVCVEGGHKWQTTAR